MLTIRNDALVEKLDTSMLRAQRGGRIVDSMRKALNIHKWSALANRRTQFGSGPIARCDAVAQRVVADPTRMLYWTPLACCSGRHWCCSGPHSQVVADPTRRL